MKFDKLWHLKTAERIKKERTLLAFETSHIQNPEDLPCLMTTEEAAPHLKTTTKNAAQMMAKGEVRSIKRRGRRYTTPQWIADYWKNETASNG